MEPQKSRKQFIVEEIARIAHIFSADKITVYAAQASFFVVISAVPFFSLLLSFISIFIPPNFQSSLSGYAFSGEMAALIESLLGDLQDTPEVPLASLSAILVLWSASKGMSAIRSGLETIYHASAPSGYVLKRLKSLVNTLVFIGMLLITMLLMVFGEFLVKHLPFLQFLASVVRWRMPLMILLVTAYFTFMYAATARRSVGMPGLRGLKNRILPHVPGAFFASIGWMVFSFFYSLYIRYSPNASYIYGGLAAVCLIMLWLYFCMIIFLSGAEINKLWAAYKEEKAHKNKS